MNESSSSSLLFFYVCLRWGLSPPVFKSLIFLLLFITVSGWLVSPVLELGAGGECEEMFCSPETDCLLS